MFEMTHHRWVRECDRLAFSGTLKIINKHQQLDMIFWFLTFTFPMLLLLLLVLLTMISELYEVRTKNQYSNCTVIVVCYLYSSNRRES